MQLASAVKAEAIQTLQQLHFFAPRHVNLSALVPDLIKGLASQDLPLRRACASCLRQLSQREARELSDHGKLCIQDAGRTACRSLEGLYKAAADPFDRHSLLL